MAGMEAMVDFTCKTCGKTFVNRTQLKHHMKSLHKPNNRRSMKKKNIKFEKSLLIVGVNAAGLSSKLQSFDKMLNDLSPGIFFVEETKMRTSGKIKTEKSREYIIFELTRKQSCGGGIAIGAHKDLNPVFISEGNNETEVLVIEICLDEISIRCAGAYGPQENDLVEKKSKFWSRLDQEVEKANVLEKGFILQMDGNLHLGPEFLPNDPNKMNKNGKLFTEFLERNPHLILVNSLDICRGLITRRRKTVKKLEEAALDFFVICNRVNQYLVKMVIDEEKKYVLTNYYQKDGKTIARDSDHLSTLMYLNIKYSKNVQGRKEMFNLKNVENQKTFNLMTSESTKFSECFSNEKSFTEQCDQWKNSLFSSIKQSFNKIRITTKPKITEISKLIGIRNFLKQKMKRSTEEETNNLKIKIEEAEKKISNLSAKENVQNIKDNFVKFLTLMVHFNLMECGMSNEKYSLNIHRPFL